MTLPDCLDRGLVDRDDRVGRLDVHAADVRTGHHDGFEGLALLIGTAICGLRLGGPSVVAVAATPKDKAKRTADESLFASSLITLSNVRLVQNGSGRSSSMRMPLQISCFEKRMAG